MPADVLVQRIFNSTLTVQRQYNGMDSLVRLAGGVAGLTSVPAGNALFVDAFYGNDSTGTRGDAVKPFLTWVGVFSKATSGDTVKFGPGTFAQGLLTNGVAVELSANTTLTTNGQIFDDTSGPAVAQVLGFGNWDLNNINMQNAGSSFNGDGQTVLGSGIDSSIVQTAGKISLHIEDMSGQNFMWWTDGVCDITADNLYHNNDSPEYPLFFVTIQSDQTGSRTGDLSIRANTIKSISTLDNTGVLRVQNSTSDYTARVWVSALLIENVDPNNHLLTAGGCRLYVFAEKTKGLIQGGAGGEFFLITQKHNGRIFGGGDNCNLNIQVLDDTGITSGNIIDISGGSWTIRGMTFVGGAATPGINLSGGTLRLIGCVINTSANATANPVTVSGGTLIIDGCTLIAHAGQACVTASTGQTITNYGSRANTAKSGNVTVNVQAILVDVNVK